MPDSKPADVPTADLEALRASLDGDALIRGDSAWEAARQAWNLVAVQEPALVVMAESVAGTVVVIRASAPPYNPSTGALIAAICSAVGGEP